ncbi:hypothetical protein LguiA_005171 [Lonicera macranthoides]
MFTLHFFPSPPQTLPHPTFSPQLNPHPHHPFKTLTIPSFQPNPCLQITKSSQNQRIEPTRDLISQIEQDNEGTEIEVEEVDESPSRARFRGRGGGEEEEDYDRNPEFAEIIGNCLDEPEKARSKMEERLRKKRNKIIHTKTGSATPMQVTFNKFDFLNSYIWFEFYNAPLEKDVSLICDTIRSWHIVGRLGGCNSLNMQLSQSPLDKRPSYDAIQGANVTPATFYNIGNLEMQDNLARLWVDIGTSEPLLLDVLVNAFTQISSDHIGIKQMVFGGSEFENWRENLTTEDAGFSVNEI